MPRTYKSRPLRATRHRLLKRLQCRPRSGSDMFHHIAPDARRPLASSAGHDSRRSQTPDPLAFSFVQFNLAGVPRACRAPRQMAKDKRPVLRRCSSSGRANTLSPLSFGRPGHNYSLVFINVRLRPVRGLMLNQCFDEASASARVSEEPVIRPTSQEAFYYFFSRSNT